jgi:hypothetical protein
MLFKAFLRHDASSRYHNPTPCSALHHILSTESSSDGWDSKRLRCSFSKLGRRSGVVHHQKLAPQPSCNYSGCCKPISLEIYHARSISTLRISVRSQRQSFHVNGPKGVAQSPCVRNLHPLCHENGSTAISPPC